MALPTANRNVVPGYALLLFFGSVIAIATMSHVTTSWFYIFNRHDFSRATFVVDSYTQNRNSRGHKRTLRLYGTVQNFKFDRNAACISELEESDCLPLRKGHTIRIPVLFAPKFINSNVLISWSRLAMIHPSYAGISAMQAGITILYLLPMALGLVLNVRQIIRHRTWLAQSHQLQLLREQYDTGIKVALNSNSVAEKLAMIELINSLEVLLGDIPNKIDERRDRLVTQIQRHETG